MTFLTSLTFTSLVAWVIAHGYFLFAIAAFLEGTIVTIAAGVAASLGYYSIVVIILIAVLVDIGGDVFYYALGYYGGEALLRRYGHYVGLTKENKEKTKNLLHRHLGKTLVVVKLSPFIPVPSIILMGSTRVSLRRFIGVALLISVPKSLLFALIGFYAGRTYEKLAGLLSNSEYALFAVMVLVILSYFGYQKIAAYIAKRAGR